MKKLKKAETYGLEDWWQIEPSQIFEVAKETEKSDYHLVAEAVETVILALEKLGYIELEDR